MTTLRSRLTYANVMSSIAVFLVLGGATAFAAAHLGHNSVGAAQLKRNAVTTSKIKRHAVTAAKIRDGAVTGAKVKLSTLGTVPSAKTAGTLAGYTRKPVFRVAASPAKATEAESRAASPEVPLFAAGPFAVYGKCFDFNAETYVGVYIKTTENGALLSSDGSGFDGAEFLETTTPEGERHLMQAAAKPNLALYFGGGGEFGATASNGMTIVGLPIAAVKNGNLPTGNGIYGPGDACLFGGQMTVVSG